MRGDVVVTAGQRTILTNPFTGYTKLVTPSFTAAIHTDSWVVRFRKENIRLRVDPYWFRVSDETSEASIDYMQCVSLRPLPQKKDSDMSCRAQVGSVTSDPESRENTSGESQASSSDLKAARPAKITEKPNDNSKAIKNKQKSTLHAMDSGFEEKSVHNMSKLDVNEYRPRVTTSYVSGLGQKDGFVVPLSSSTSS